MPRNKRIKTDNNNKIFQDFIDFEILTSIINYLLISKRNNNNNNNNNQYKINRFYLNRNEILNYILVSKKWYNFISLTISNNIINNKLFEHWLEINNNKSFIENNNNQNQYNKNNLIFKNKDNKRNKISFNKEFSIIKIKKSIINDYFKFNLFLHHITIDDFKEIKKKFENNQLVYKRIVANVEAGYEGDQDEILFKIHKYISNENSEIISNLFKILELNHEFLIIEGSNPGSDEGEEEEEEEEDDDDDEEEEEEEEEKEEEKEEEEEEEEDHNDNEKCDKKCNELYLNNLSISGFDRDLGEDRESIKIFKIFKSKNIIYDGSDVETIQSHANYSTLFDPENSGQQVESIKIKNDTDEVDGVDFVDPHHLIKVNQFENLHSITIPINSFQILSNLSKEMGYFSIDCINSDFGNSDNMKSELNQMIDSIITSKSLKNLKISSISTAEDPIDYDAYYDEGDLQTFVNSINEIKESFSNSFKPLFSESNTSIERIELDCCGLLNVDTFSNLLNNKSIKYLYLYDSDFLFCSLRPTDGGGGGGSDDESNQCDARQELISINQYLFDNIFSSSLTSIRHYRICFRELNELKLIFKLILNNIFKLQLYSLIFEFNENELIVEFVEEYKYLINNIPKQQQQQKQKSNNINLKEIKIKMNDDKYSEELNNINNPYFTTIIKNFQ
ncbi:hypothetical protein ACTFIZ_001950 [Dictyostelium cf. discoideum]